MRIFSVIIPCALVFLFACNQSQSNKTADSGEKTVDHPIEVAYDNASPQPDMTPADSVELFEVDNIVKSVEAQRKELTQENLRPNLHSEDDHLFISYEGGNVKEVVLSTQPNEGKSRVRSYFYFDGKKLRFYRYLEWHTEVPESFAREVIVFFTDGKIFDVEERRMEMKDGTGPVKLLNQKFIRPAINKKALEKSIEADWAKTRKLIEEHAVNFRFDK